MESGNFPLQFTIEILSAHFSSPGRYFLVLRIVGRKVKPSTVKLYIGNSQNALDSHEFTTDACLEDGDPDTFATFNDSLISFWMPAGSANGDIQLVLEAFHLPENPLHKEVKYGEAVFEVFPRKTPAFSNIRQKTPLSDNSNEVYQFETNIKFTQILKEEGFSTNCGLVRATVKLDQIKEPKPEAREVDWNFLQKQQRAGSLANLCPSFDVDYRLSTEYLSNDRVYIEEDEEEVISVWDNEEESFVKENSAPTSARQSQTVKLVFSDDELGQSDLNEHDFSPTGKAIELVFEDVQPGGSMGSGIVEAAHIIESQPDDSRIHSIPLSVDDEIFESLTPQELQNQSHRIDYSFREEWQKDDGQRISYNRSNREDEAAAALFSAWRWENQASKPVAEAKTVSEPVAEAKTVSEPVAEARTVAEPVAEAKTVAEPVAEAKTVAEPVAEAKTVAEPVAEAKTVEKPQPIKPLLLPVPGDPGPGPSSAAEVSFTNKIQESALGNNVGSIPIHHLCGSYLARAGYCEVAILAHGAIGLPLNSYNRTPQPYIVGKSGKREAQGLVGQSVTHAATNPTQSPCWEELLLVEIKEEEEKNEAVILLTADHPSKELLTEYRVPLEHIKPFHQYHLELVQPNSELNSDSRLYVTVMKKMDKLPLPPLGSNVYGLEVLLRSFEQQLNSQMGPLIATLRIVSDWEEYRGTMLSPQPRPTGVTVTTIQFPSPHPTLFAVAGATPPHGAPQVTTAGRPQEQPRWNQTLLFLGQESSLFTAKSACVVEYYPAVLAMTRDSWQLTSPIGYSYQSLDQLLLSSLQCDEAKLGLKLDNIPVEFLKKLCFCIGVEVKHEHLGSKLRTVTRTCPTIGLVARLITEEKPEPYLISATNLASLPAFRAKLPTNQQSQLSHVNQPDLTTYRQISHGLPPMDAVKSILPHFHSLYTGPRTEPVQEYVPLMISSPPVRGTSVASDGTPNSAQVRGSLDDKNLAVMDYQMKEVDRYRTAMRTMATDLLHVREDCKRLEEENSRFRRNLTQHEEISRLMVSSQDLDHITHSELVQKFVLLQKKLADESNKKQELQNRLVHLQNDLIKKNETEKEYFKLQEAHEGQQALLHELQVKVQKRKAIQDTCKKQEKVIVQLEKLLAQQRQGQFNGVAETSDTYRFLSDENTKLQSEVSQYKEMLRQVEAKQKLPRSPDKHITSEGPMSDLERLELYEKLEKAEGRIVALEKQLADNVRKWAKDKADLQMKLNEKTTAQKTGFKTSTSASMDILDWHNGPKPPSPARHLGPRRPSPKLEPLERR